MSVGKWVDLLEDTAFWQIAIRAPPGGDLVRVDPLWIEYNRRAYYENQVSIRKTRMWEKRAQTFKS